MQFHDQLLQFPLFQGLSRNELLQMSGNTKFGFQKLASDKYLIHEGDPCQQLIFLTKGQMTVTQQSDDHAYSVVEQVHAPWLLQPERLFGAQTRYTLTARATTELHLITLTKDEVERLMNDFLIIHLNMLNMLATQAQRRAHLPWRRAPQSLRERIIRFLLDHCIYPAGPKEFRILREQLAQEVGDSARDVTAELKNMQATGLIALHRGRIEVPSIERLLM